MTAFRAFRLRQVCILEEGIISKRWRPLPAVAASTIFDELSRGLLSWYIPSPGALAACEVLGQCKSNRQRIDCLLIIVTEGFIAWPGVPVP